VLWVRSHRREDSIVWQGSHPAGIVAPGERWVGVEWGHGIFSAYVWWPVQGMGTGDHRWLVHSFDDPRRGFAYRRGVLRRTEAEALWRLGFGAWGTDHYSRDGRFLFGSRNYGVPFWFLCALFAVIPCVHLVQRLLVRRRRTKGLCPTCGYDLRATPGLCPECGTIPPAQKEWRLQPPVADRSDPGSIHSSLSRSPHDPT